MILLETYSVVYIQHKLSTSYIAAFVPLMALMCHRGMPTVLVWPWNLLFCDKSYSSLLYWYNLTVGLVTTTFSERILIFCIILFSFRTSRNYHAFKKGPVLNLKKKKTKNLLQVYVCSNQEFHILNFEHIILFWHYYLLIGLILYW